MPQSQLYPLEVDPQTGEPFLVLPKPLDNIIITPPRPSDVASLVSMLNEPDVYKWLWSVPHPFSETNAEARLQRAMGRSEQAMKELREAEEAFPEGPLQFVNGCPVTVIREAMKDGTQVYIGDVIVRRHTMMHLSEGVREKAVEDNQAIPVGDESILWAMGGTFT